MLIWLYSWIVSVDRKINLAPYSRRKETSSVSQSLLRYQRDVKLEYSLRIQLHTVTHVLYHRYLYPGPADFVDAGTPWYHQSFAMHGYNFIRIWIVHTYIPGTRWYYTCLWHTDKHGSDYMLFCQIIPNILCHEDSLSRQLLLLYHKFLTKILECPVPLYISTTPTFMHAFLNVACSWVSLNSSFVRHRQPLCSPVKSDTIVLAPQWTVAVPYQTCKENYSSWISRGVGSNLKVVRLVREVVARMWEWASPDSKE